MMMHKKMVKIGLIALLTIGLAAPGVLAKGRAVKVATSTQATHIYNVGLEYFAKRVKEKTNGALDIRIFPAAQLGSERDFVEGLQPRRILWETSTPAGSRKFRNTWP